MPTPDPAFAWPPRRPAGNTQEPAPSPVPRGVHGPNLHAALARRPAGWLSQFERTWLDTTAPPLAERMTIERWRPDVPGDYCYRCGQTLTDAPPTANGCPACEHTRPSWHRIVRLGSYDEPLRSWIHEIKFTQWRRLGTDLGRLLGAAAADEIKRLKDSTGSEQVRAILSRPPMVVPMPTTFWRLAARGIDHARTLARGVAWAVGGQVVQPLRREHRPSQTEVAPSSRAVNVSRALRARSQGRLGKLDGRLILVVDDVTTTGSTLRSACRALREGGVNPKETLIWAAVAAVAGHAEGSERGTRAGDHPSA